MVQPLNNAVVEPESPGTARAQRILRAYLEDVANRYYGRQATDDEMEAALRDFSNGDLTEPHGVFLVARADGSVRGCAGLRFLPDRLGEVTRLFVVETARGHGLGSQLMEQLESLARERGLDRLRLDTRSDLVEARRLYTRHGYREVAPFNNNWYAEHWFEKTLA